MREGLSGRRRKSGGRGREQCSDDSPIIPERPPNNMLAGVVHGDTSLVRGDVWSTAPVRIRPTSTEEDMTEPWPEYLNRKTPLEHLRYILYQCQCNCDTTQYDHEGYCHVPALKRAEAELVRYEAALRDIADYRDNDATIRALRIAREALYPKETP